MEHAFIVDLIGAWTVRDGQIISDLVVHWATTVLSLVAQV